VDKPLFTAKNVIVQGITGSQGTFHTRSMVAAGTNVVAGTSPNKAGQTLDGIPVYKTIDDIKRQHSVDVSVIFVPAASAKGAILEAIDAEIPLIVCITEGVPIHDMLQIKQRLKKGESILIGPNCPGVLLPSVNKLGIIPANMATPGSVGIVSRSGTLTYEAMAGLTERGIGQKYVIGIGGDPIRGTGFIECLELFENDPEVTSIVMIGEIGGNDEHGVAEYIKANITKLVYAYVAGHSAPPGVQLGHAGAIMGGQNESASAKTEALRSASAITSTSIVDLVRSVK
jgi:succinyl-CoA synthetase alpha subunit